MTLVPGLSYSRVEWLFPVFFDNSVVVSYKVRNRVITTTWGKSRDKINMERRLGSYFDWQPVTVPVLPQTTSAWECIHSHGRPRHGDGFFEQ